MPEWVTHLLALCTGLVVGLLALVGFLVGVQDVRNRWMDRQLTRMWRRY